MGTMIGYLERRLDPDSESVLIARAKEGDFKSQETLIKAFQPFVFNVALRMVGNYHEAEDLSQDIMLKAILKLPTFKAESRFGTWLFRIAVNHVLNMKASLLERGHASLDQFADDEFMEKHLGDGLADPRPIAGDRELLVKEVRIKCMLGMLLCLNRMQRVVFIMGAILGIGGRAASRILEITEGNFRKILSRARKRLANYMGDRCGLLDPGKPCSCERSVAPSVRDGYIDTLSLVFNANGAPAIREILSLGRARLDNVEYKLCQDLYRDHPFQESPDFSERVLAILNGDDVQGFLDAFPTSRA